MSKRLRSLVGAILSASICSSCVSSGLSKGVKWAVGVPVTGALVYFGGRKLGLWGTNRRGEVHSNYSCVNGMEENGDLLHDGNYDVQLSSEKKVEICAKKIKEFVGKDNYNVLKKFYELEKENLGNSGKPVGSKLASEGLVLEFSTFCNLYGVGEKVYKSVDEVLKNVKPKLLNLISDQLKSLFNSIFVSGNFVRLYKGGGSKFIFQGFKYGIFVVSFSDDGVFICCKDADYELDFKLKLSKSK